MSSKRGGTIGKESTVVINYMNLNNSRSGKLSWTKKVVYPVELSFISQSSFGCISNFAAVFLSFDPTGEEDLTKFRRIEDVRDRENWIGTRYALEQP